MWGPATRCQKLIAPGYSHTLLIGQGDRIHNRTSTAGICLLSSGIPHICFRRRRLVDFLIFSGTMRIYTRLSRAELRTNLECQLNNVGLLRHRGCFLLQQFPNLEHLQ
jgi:hypothetical protein